jgi:hypothetical protein
MMDWRWAGVGVLPTSTSVAISEIDIRTVTPKNGPRQLMAPSSPPSSGPSAMPTPSAVSYKMIAPAKPPLAEATMTARDVAMNSALPRPHPARNHTIWPIPAECPASALNTTISTRPPTSVRFAPMREDTQPVTSMATAVTTR